MFEATGSKMEIVMQMVEELQISTKEASLIFDYLKDHPNLVSDGEKIIDSISAADDENNMLGLLIPDTGYYINVKKATIFVLATILDCYVTKGALNAALTLTGVNCQAILKLKGEKLCLITEMIRERDKLNDATDLSRYEQECVNNHIKCSYNISGVCTLKKEMITSDLKYFEEKEIAERIGEKYKAIIL